MHYLLLMKVVKSYDQLPGKEKKGFKRRRTKIFVEFLECASHIVHKDESLFSKMIVLNIPDDILMRNFRQNINLSFAFLLIRLAQMHLLNSIKTTRLNIQSPVNSTRPTPSNHLSNSPLIQPRKFLIHIILNDPLFPLLQQQRYITYHRWLVWICSGSGLFSGFELHVEIGHRFKDDGICFGHHVLQRTCLWLIKWLWICTVN